MKKDDTYYMKLAINEAKKAYSIDEIPVGAIIYSKKLNKVIARSHNKRDSENIVTSHAEIRAIEKANKKINNWRLLNTVLYCTLEPCDMCIEVIKAAKVEKVVYGATGKNRKTELNITQIENKEIIKECEELIKNKFKEIRLNNKC